jgi:hypothetical protein
MADPVTVTYLDVEPQVRTMLHRFQFKYGGDLEDYQSLASQVFLKVYHDCNTKKGAFEKRLLWCLWRRLLSARRQELRVNSRFTDNSKLHLVPRTQSPMLDDLFGRLSDRAVIVAKLALSEASQKLYSEVAETPFGQSPCKTTQTKINIVVRKIKKQLADWPEAQVKRTFQEIRIALTMR